MIPYGRASLRAEGFVVMPFEDSMAREPARLRPHYHDFFQVSLLAGPGRLMHDFREKDVRGLTLFFLSPGQVHTVQPGPGLRGTIVSFTRDFFDAGSPAAARLLLELPFYFASEAPPWLSLDAAGEDASAFRALFRELQAEYDQAHPGAAEILRALLRIVFVKASRRLAAAQDAPRAHRATALVREFQLEIEKHFSDQPALGSYARRLGVSVNHLNDVVRETTGLAAGEHIRRRRLLDAKRQLLHSELSVSEIGYRLGFKDPSYFSRFFRRYERVSPATFRRQSREKYQQLPA